VCSNTFLGAGEFPVRSRIIIRREFVIRLFLGYIILGRLATGEQQPLSSAFYL